MSTPLPANKASFRLQEVAEITGGRLTGAHDCELVGICTDTRNLGGGNLFVALRGERFDGHAFVQGAAAAGAGAALVEEGAVVPAQLPVVAVPDTLVALGCLAQAHRERWGGVLVAITGSVGKTGTRALTSAGLSAAGCSVHSTAGNLNNRVGVPLTLFGLDASHDTAVVELGTSEPGEIAKLAKMVQADVGVVTAVSAAHTEGMGGLDEVLQEKGALLRAVKAGGCTVVRGDDAGLRSLAATRDDIRILTFGLGADNDVQLREWITEEAGTHCSFVFGNETQTTILKLLGEAPALNAAAALCIAIALGRSTQMAASGMSQVLPVAGRLCPSAGPLDSLLLDDTYNASPASTRVAIETAASLARRRDARFIAALGDMRELGSLAQSAHLEVGRQLAKHGAAHFVAVGNEMKRAAEAAGQAGVHTSICSTSTEAGDMLQDLLQARDVVLVKGSRTMQMENALAVLTEGAEP